MNKLPIPREYVGSVCEIKSMDNRLIAIGRIKDVNIENIKISNDKTELKMVDFGTPIKINVFNNKAGFRVLVGSVYTSTRVEMTVDGIYNLVDKERRNFFRVDMSIAAKIFYKKSLDDEFMSEENATVLDMSLSGIKCKTKCKFDIGKTFYLELDLNGKKKSIFQCRVMRINKDQFDNYHYGCEFVYSKSEDADLLCSYLFKKQREFLYQRERY